MSTKGERREKIRKNNRKMQVRGRSIFTILRVNMEKAHEAQKQGYGFGRGRTGKKEGTK